MQVADKIRAARRAKGMTQRDVATALNVTPGAVAQWEGGGNGGRGISSSNLVKVCLLLGIEMDQLGILAPDPVPVTKPDEIALLDLYGRMTAKQQRTYLALFHMAVGEPVEQPDSPSQGLQRIS
jgi:transcriptional regulator with XRE-family HTH domain